ncbi:MAG: phosphoesterase [Methanomicrobiales archaeon]|nr:phosphoesterase [Methanomicrobiales archaeon]
MKSNEEEMPEIGLVRDRSSHIIHLTHNDLDAVGADAIHRIKFGELLSIFSSVGKFPHLLSAIADLPGNGDLISISDLGFPRGAEKAVKKLKNNNWNVEWRDHHRWTDEEVATVEKNVALLHIDTSRCGCGICATDLLPDDPVAQEIARVVCDYDLWKNEDPRAAVLGLVLQRRKNLIHVRDCLKNGVFTDPKIEREYNDIRTEMDQMMEKSRRKAVIMNGKYTIAFVPLFGYPSETAAYIRKTLGTDIEVIVSRGGRFSLRSVPPISHLVTREYRGGGHPHAAGGNFDFTWKDRILFILFGKNSHFKKFAEVADSF